MKGALHPGFLFAIWLFGLFGLVPMTLLLQTLFPRFLRRVSNTVERAPWQSFLIGFLGVAIALLAGMRLSKPFGFLVLVFFGAALAFSLAAIFKLLGSRMFFSMNSPQADLAWPSTLLGGVVLWMSALLPVLGQLVLITSCILGLGGLLISLFSPRAKAPAVPPVLPKM